MEQLSIFKINEHQDFNSVCDILECENNIPAWPDSFGDAVTEYLKKKNIPKIRTLSLFSGAGGLDIGFSDIGFDIIESVEIESKFCKTLEMNSGVGKRFENSKVNCIDIKEFSSEHLGKIDFIIGGPPCQTFSAAGRRSNGVLGITDARGVLFREYVRLLQELSPVGFLFENVYGIIGAQGGEPWKEILNSFSEVGYKLYYRVLDAADYGVPQHRERLIIVGLKEGSFKFPRPTHGPDSLDKEPFYNAETAIEGINILDEEDIKEVGGRYGSLLNDIPPGLNYSFYTEKMGHPNPIFAWRSKFSDFLYKADPNVPVRTIKASGGAYTGPFHWDNRWFTYKEYKRLQTFPDNYEISGSKQIAVKQIGNSVPPQLARIMAIAIRQQVFHTEFPFKLSLLDDSEELTFRKRKRNLTSVYRKKAELAISALKCESKGLPDSHEYYCDITEDFDYKKTKKASAKYRINVDWNKELNISVYEIESDNSRVNMHFEITPNDKGWNIGVDKVIINVFTSKISAFTVAWKAFEYELASNSIKADIVQLNGYYQYDSRINCLCVLDKEIQYGTILESIVSGKNVAKMMSASKLCASWGVLESELINIAEFLRKVGYEIRNHNTNPQIENNYWLIPYAFPTLTKLSVQLRKKV